MTAPERNGTTQPPSDWDILRRFLGHLNHDTYSVDLLTLAPIKGSYKPKVLREDARAALVRLEAKHGG